MTRHRPGARARAGTDTVTDVLFVDCYPKHLYGAQKTLIELATGAAQRPAVLVPAPGALVDALDELDIPVDVLTYPKVLRQNGRALMGGSPRVRLRTAVALVAYSLRAARIIRRRGALVVYCSNSRAVLSVGLGARLLRRPVIWYVQQLEESFGMADRLAARLATRVVSISADGGSVIPPELQRRLRSRFTAIPLGTAIPSAPPARDGDGPITFGVVGVVTPNKGHDILVAAFAEARRSSPGCRLRLRVLGVPSTPDDERFQDAVRSDAARLGVSDAVEWVGWVDDIAAAFCEIDVLVSASKVEGLPRVIMEAMAQGIPVIATDVGATRDLVHDDHTGMLVPAGDVRALAEAMARSADDPELRCSFGAAGYKLVSQRFDRVEFIRAFAREFEMAARR